MIEKIRFYLGSFLLFILTHPVMATPIFNVTASGPSAGLSLTVCANGTAPLSCTNYWVSGLDLMITTNTAHIYPEAGIKINTFGYTLENCSLTRQGYCLFSVGPNAPTALTVLAPTIAVDETGIIPVNGGSGSLTVTNNGDYTAYNVRASLPSEWTGVTQNANDCRTLAAHDTCSLSFTSTTPYLAQGGIVVSGSNVVSPPTTALAFQLGTGLVFSISGHVASVVSQLDISSDLGIAWTTSPLSSGAMSLTNGNANTTTIVTAKGEPYTDYAAGLCHSYNTGSGTWYLPAICQLGPFGSTASCESGTANIFTNLFSLGFVSGMATGGNSSESIGNYWSSTNDGTSYAWAQNFSEENNSFTVPQDFFLGVRCVQDIHF